MAETLAFPEPEAVTQRKRRRRGLMLLGGVFALLLALVATLYFSPLLSIRHIEITGNDLLTDARAQELVSELYGTPLPQVGTREVSRMLEDESVVAEVDSTAELPHTLHITLVEHPPVAEVHEEDAVRFYNEHGQIIREFPGHEAMQAEGYPTAEISSEAALEDQAVFDTIVSVLGQLPEEAREATETATAGSIDSVQLQLRDGRTIIWGSDDQGQEKAAVLQAILASDAEEFTDVETIDISTPLTPVTR
ncbi:cell division protein FtsQ/DivIB [Nesterenkonia flava]|uniref:FtsQ-type POTRA domain-containing protein n=1 Tax=Nesterenkonia flava TaxID=469799 RepID=A0ABU1FV56_9MICC|nr:FtsQ-type POTRA domain-containing protein [Nesterenkonia flava]MDR5712543.1 FtsQ-type POTRA domain-containing protein [Nesterenkonia flava]